MSVHIGAVKAKTNAHPSVNRYFSEGKFNEDSTLILFAQPVLFSKRVKASFVETLLSPDATKSAIIAAMDVPTRLQNVVSS